MSDNFIQLNEDLIKHDLKDLVRSSVEETLRLCQDFFAKVKFCRLVAGSQPAMISDARSSSALKR